MNFLRRLTNFGPNSEIKSDDSEPISDGINFEVKLAKAELEKMESKPLVSEPKSSKDNLAQIEVSKLEPNRVMK